MIKPTIPLLGLILAAVLAWPAAADPTPEAVRLTRVLDGAGVERLWPAGVHVDWETGVPDGKPVSDEGQHTHCSAFVAAVAKRLDIYILRPPEHGARLLANAQYDWLVSEGPRYGWWALADGHQAQVYANQGELVVAVYKNHHDDKPGHIALVRPSAKSAAEIDKEGPQITQAGSVNYPSTTLKRGFAGHPAAWTRREVRYFAHAIDWETGAKP
ncbi:MAG: hypothetical protein P9E88_13280 [Candidatus Competibacter sp.]|nr:hypothetical protein [Candidatus Competibacter sp.]